MSLGDGPFSEIKPPAAWLAAAALVVAAIGAAALFGGGQGAGPARRTADGIAGPVDGALAAPVRAAGGVLGGIGAYFMAGSQNRELRSELTAALSWRDETLALRQENARLRALLGLKTQPPIPMVAADTVLDARGPFSNSRLADVGANEGVTEGDPVLSDHGLVGRVAGVGPDVSRVLLLTDVESRTPVMIARTNGRAILAGDGGANPALDYLRTHDPVQPGDVVLTSGDGGVFPRGLPVGVVVRGLDGGWRVALDADAQPIGFVRVLLYRSFDQLNAPPPAAGALPSTATDAPEPASPTAVNATSNTASNKGAAP